MFWMQDTTYTRDYKENMKNFLWKLQKRKKKKLSNLIKKEKYKFLEQVMRRWGKSCEDESHEKMGGHKKMEKS